MILGVMQPYLFPYLGYYQLVMHCDKFVFYDDVAYIKGGYINRNNILSQGQEQLITVPVNQASSFKKINELSFALNLKKPIKSIAQSYSKAPYFDDVMPLVLKVLNLKDRNIAKITSVSVAKVFAYLGIEKTFYFSSNLNYDRQQSAHDKLISMCKHFGATQYCNSIGGRSLYTKEQFSEMGISLNFLEMNELTYPQANNKFVSNLSMLDILMWNSKEEATNLLTQYTII